MHDSVRLGRILGVPIGINWTWAIVFAFFAWSLATEVFPTTNPGLDTGTYTAMAVIAVVVFFASLLAHELGHAAVARREGMTIDGITLWLFGGVARFRGPFPSAGAEFRIAIAGPAVTAVLATIFVAFARVTPLGSAVDGVVAWLGYINALLLGFNLLPALPLDGGRVLRAGLWKLRNDLGWATRIAALVGRGFAVVMMAGGAALFLFHGAVSDLWLALIGWFLFGSATAEARMARGAEGLTRVVASDVMNETPVAAQADQRLGDFMNQVSWSKEHRAYPVLDGERPVGVLALRDVANTPPHAWASLRVREIMVALDKVVVARDDEQALEVLDALMRDRNGLALVVNRATLVGVITLADLKPYLESPRSAPLRVPLARAPRPRDAA